MHLSTTGRVRKIQAFKSKQSLFWEVKTITMQNPLVDAIWLLACTITLLFFIIYFEDRHVKTLFFFSNAYILVLNRVFSQSTVGLSFASLKFGLCVLKSNSSRVYISSYLVNWSISLDFAYN